MTPILTPRWLLTNSSISIKVSFSKFSIRNHSPAASDILFQASSRIGIKLLLQVHAALETNSPFRLIPHWTILGLYAITLVAYHVDWPSKELQEVAFQRVMKEIRNVDGFVAVNSPMINMAQ